MSYKLLSQDRAVLDRIARLGREKSWKAEKARFIEEHGSIAEFFCGRIEEAVILARRPALLLK